MEVAVPTVTASLSINSCYETNSPSGGTLATSYDSNTSKVGFTRRVSQYSLNEDAADTQSQDLVNNDIPFVDLGNDDIIEMYMRDVMGE